MKTLTKTLFTAALLAFAGQSFAKPTNGGSKDGSYVVTDRKPTAGFNGVNVGGPFDVSIVQGPVESIKVSAPSEVMNMIVTEVNNGILKVSGKNDGRDWDSWCQMHKRIVVYVTVKDLKSINVSGSGSAFFKDGLTLNSLKLNLSGSGNMIGNLNVKNLESDISGLGNIKLSGKAEMSTVRIASSGDFTAANLITTKSDVHISGSGDAEINAREKVSAEVNGAGSVLYTGDAKIISGTKNGGGDIAKFNLSDMRQSLPLNIVSL